jgi:hypothetical protein
MMMIAMILAALAMAQTSPVPPPPAGRVPMTVAADYRIAQPVGGAWSYSRLRDGSEARFVVATGAVQLALRCARSVRRVTISKASSAPSPSLLVWTTGASRTLAAPGFDASSGRLNVQLSANDPLLDAMVFSRGRIAVGAGSAPALVVPPWPELARVVEDCRV